ncbi:epithelial-stromal interaction protein 1-like [Sorex araneus]|uniref:epithelial-stromal interaction protein 1-like n=1 Tax=Sorex araneus TaxID=42254 RepID=UPI002433A7EE|nr:epithelial-stromal interaction protein 1-like [Sorex araneus]
MYSRSRTLGSGLRAPQPAPAPQPARDPSGRLREPGPLQRPSPGLEPGPEASKEHPPPTLTSAYTLIKPNESRRNQIQRTELYHDHQLQIPGDI